MKTINMRAAFALLASLTMSGCAGGSRAELEAETRNMAAAPIEPQTIAAEELPPPEPGEFDVLGAILANPGSAGFQAFFNPPAIHPDVVNTRAWRAAELAGGNGHGNARGLARIYGALATDGRLDGKVVLTPETIAKANTEQSRGPDVVLAEQSTRFGLGFMMTQGDVAHAAFGPNAHAFGHPGAGGSLGYADPDARIGFGYVMNQMRPGLVTGPRAQELIDALYACL